MGKRNTTIHIRYPKNKDHLTKTRIITSYFGFQLKKLYKIASRAGTWLLRKLPKIYRHFTLHKISDIKTRIKEGVKWIKRKYGNKTYILSFQSDVKQMYTNLCTKEIMKAINWLLNCMKKTCPKRKQYSEILSVSKSAQIKYPHNVRWGRGTDYDNTTTVTFQDLKNIFTIDLKYSYTTALGKLYYQKIGCPIGGYLSAFYANVVCAYHEWCYISTLERKGIRIYGIRQMDDLLYG